MSVSVIVCLVVFPIFPAILVGMFLYNYYMVDIKGVKYRTNADFRKVDENGVECSCGGEFQESPWKWLAIARAKKWVAKDPSIFRAYVEDISDGVFNQSTCTGETVWEWNKKGDNK